MNAVDEIKGDLPDLPIFLQGNVKLCPSGMNKWDEKFSTASETPISKSVRDGITFRDTMCYINTSGTTGRIFY